MSKHFVIATAAILSLAGVLRAEITPKNFDLTVKPQDDFFLYVNGSWLKTVTIPPDQSRWGSFTELNERNQDNLRTLCERAVAKSREATALERQVGDFYASGMDQAAIDAAGLAPIQTELARIAAVKTSADVVATIAHLQSLGINVGFRFGSSPDPKNSTQEIADLRQGGLGLPDRDYYLNDDEKSKNLRAQYTAHVAKIFELSGISVEAGQRGASSVLKLETALAQASLSRVKLRDPYMSYHKMPVTELATYTGPTDWPGFFKTLAAPAFTEINLAHPEFFKAFAAQLNETPLGDWQAYLRWHLLHGVSPYLSSSFEQETFNFYGATLAGEKEMKPRWKRIVASTDGHLGEALGQLYVAEYFPPTAKARVLKLVDDLRAALGTRLKTLDWMDEATRIKALAKLNAFTVKMGYPEKWKDYSSVKIDRSSYVLNVLNAIEYEQRRIIARIGKPVDKAEWGMTPPTVNAYYRSSANEIVFPAGILQPPFFDPNADDAVNYGGIGTVIGHEMTHGFDDGGRQFDGQGNLTDWWSPQSAEKFKARAAGIVKQFSEYTVVDSLHLNGELTQGENIADLGGLKVAFVALQKALKDKPRTSIDGFTPEQRFFLSYAAVWRDIMRPEEQRRRVKIDPHAPGQWRVRGPLSNLDEFAEAFHVPDDAPMHRPAAERVTIW